MAPKTIKEAIANMLEDLSEKNLEKFRDFLVDRRQEPRVRRGRVEGKSYLEISNVLVQTFTEDGAVQVAVEILNQMCCDNDAKRLVEETAGLSSKPGSGNTARPSSGAAAENTVAQGGCEDDHFVDKHKLELTQRVYTIAPILDELLFRKVIKQETYDKIRALSTPQDRMREIYAALGNTKTCKDIFFEILKKNESFLIEDLQKKS